MIRIKLIGTILIDLSIRRSSLRRIDRLRRLMRWIRYGPKGMLKRLGVESAATASTPQKGKDMEVAI